MTLLILTIPTAHVITDSHGIGIKLENIMIFNNYPLLMFFTHLSLIKFKT